MNLGNLFSGPDMASGLMPEWILVLGIIAMLVVPNIGNATFRLPIPGKSWRIPYLIGGKRFALTGDPRLPKAIAAFTLFASFITALLSQIIDSGVGMDEGTQKKLFTPFHTTKKKGSGLGLPISLKIVEDHHGKIKVTSEKGLGTTVQVFLPIRKR